MVAPPPESEWTARLQPLVGLTLDGALVELLVTALGDAVILEAIERFLNLLDAPRARYFTAGVTEPILRMVVDHANRGILGKSVRDVFVVGITIAPSNRRLLECGAKLEAFATKAPRPDVKEQRRTALLEDARYAILIAEELAAFFGTAAIDLGILSLPATVQPPPDSTVASWATWLRSCTAETVESVLSFVALFSPAKAEATTHYLRRKRVFAGGLAVLDNVDDDQIVVNRSELDRNVQSLLTARKRILRIQGERGEGKTFTRTILRALLDGDHRVVDVDVAGASLSSITEMLLRGVKSDLKIVNDSTNTKWPEKVAEVLLHEATRRRGSDVPITYWFVFDGCSTKTKEDEVGSFILQLGRLVQKSADSQYVPRMILIEAQEVLTSQRRPILLDERLTPIVQGDVEAFFKKKCGVDAVKATELATEVLEKMATASDPTLRLKIMQNKILSILEQLP
jgi:hypothetical protein